MLCIITSIPKSGTYFVNSIINEACNFTRKSFNSKFSGHSNDVQKRELNKFRKELESADKDSADIFCLLGHWRCTPLIRDEFKKYKVMFVYRHPLDMAVSFVEGTVSGLFVDLMTEKLKVCTTKEEMYRNLLYGVKSVRHPWANGMKAIFENRIDWIKQDWVTVPKYRDLRNLRIDPISSALGIPKKFILRGTKEAISHKEGLTYRRGLIDGWKEEMPKEIQKEYIDTLGDLILQLGFEV